MASADMDCFACLLHDSCMKQLPLCDFIDQNKVIFLDFDVDDIVYTCTCSWRPPVNEDEITAWIVVSYAASRNKKYEKKLKYRICELKNGKTTSNQQDFGSEDIGTKVFYTRDEAVMAFKESF